MDTANMANGFEFHVPSLVQTAQGEQTVSAEVGREFVLPDYQPEIRKLLRVTATVQPPSRFLGADEAEFAGNVSFDVLYTGGDGGLYSANLSAPYSFRTVLTGDDRTVGDRPICLNAALTAEGVNARPIAPRKLKISCRLSAHIAGFADREVDMRIDDPTLNCQRLEQTRLCARTFSAIGEAMELTDEIPVPAGEGELRLIGTEGAVQITEAIPGETGVNCRGELYVKLHLTRDAAVEGEAGAESSKASFETITRRIPFSQTVEMPPLWGGQEQTATAFGCCSEITARVEEDRLLCAATVVLEASVQGNERVSFVRDCYATDRATECEMITYSYCRAVCCVNGNVTSGGTVNRAQAGIPSGIVPLDLCGTAVVTGLVIERGHPVLTGDCTYRLLYRSAEGELGHAEFHLPLRYEMPDGGLSEDHQPVADARLTMLSGRIRPEGEEYTVDAEWAIAARVYTHEQIKAVDEVRVTGEAAPMDGTYILCYPSEGDTLWSVAKRYRTSLRGLAASNDLSGAADPSDVKSLEGVRFLMIS